MWFSGEIADNTNTSVVKSDLWKSYGKSSVTISYTSTLIIFGSKSLFYLINSIARFEKSTPYKINLFWHTSKRGKIVFPTPQPISKRTLYFCTSSEG